MTSHLTEHPLISDVKHGFVKRRSSLTQYLTFTTEFTGDIILVDFPKAFDSVTRSKLIVVLQDLNISSFILKWIKNYLSGRAQQTCIERNLYTHSQVISDAPQGAYLILILLKTLSKG